MSDSTTLDTVSAARTRSLSTKSDSALSGTRRPVRALLYYYLLRSFTTGPGLVIVLPISIFRYRTLRYQFDIEGLTVRWGILFRREVTLTYARIQDINLVSNVVERWFGLGRVRIQTASGQADAEVTIEGLPDFEAVRDELYQRMRGARGLSTAMTSTAMGGSDDLHAVALALQEATTELRALRQALEQKKP